MIKIKDFYHENFENIILKLNFFSITTMDFLNLNFNHIYPISSFYQH